MVDRLSDHCNIYQKGTSYIRQRNQMKNATLILEILDIPQFVINFDYLFFISVTYITYTVDSIYEKVYYGRSL